MTVSELIDALQKFPQDAPIGRMNYILEEVEEVVLGSQSEPDPQRPEDALIIVPIVVLTFEDHYY